MLTLNQSPEKDLSEPGWCSYNWKVDTFQHAAHDKTGGHGPYVLAISHEKNGSSVTFMAKLYCCATPSRGYLAC